MYPMLFWVGIVGLQRLLRRQAGPVLASSPQHAVEARGRHDVLANSHLVEAEIMNELRDKAAGPGRKIRITRVSPANVRPEGAVRTRHIRVVIKLVGRGRC